MNRRWRIRLFLTFLREKEKERDKQFPLRSFLESYFEHSIFHLLLFLPSLSLGSAQIEINAVALMKFRKSKFILSILLFLSALQSMNYFYVYLFYMKWNGMELNNRSNFCYSNPFHHLFFFQISIAISH